MKGLKLLALISFIICTPVYGQTTTRVESKKDSLLQVVAGKSGLGKISADAPAVGADSLPGLMKNKSRVMIDSMKTPGAVDTVLYKRLLVFRMNTDSLNSGSGINDSVQHRIQKLYDKKDYALSRDGVNDVDPPPFKLQQTNSSLDGIHEKLSLASLPVVPSGDLKSQEVPGAEQIGMPDVNLKLPGNDIGIPDASVKSEDLKKYTKDTENVSGKVQDVQNEIKDLRTPDAGDVDDFSDDVESKLKDLDEIDELQKKVEELEKMKAIKANWNDPDAAKEEALSKAKESAVNHFAGREEELKAAMDKLAALKAKHPHVEGVLDLFARRQKAMNGVPLIERFVPGFTFQFQKSQSVWLDINPQLGFKISGRFIGGLGWNDRLAFDFDEDRWDRKNRMYGIRSFVHSK